MLLLSKSQCYLRGCILAYIPQFGSNKTLFYSYYRLFIDYFVDRGMHQILMCIPWGGTRTLTITAQLFLDLLSFVSAFSHSNQQLFGPSLRNTGEIWEAEMLSLQTRNRGHGKAFVPKRTLRCSAQLCGPPREGMEVPWPFPICISSITHTMDISLNKL